MGISPEQALDCFLSDDLIGIGMEADAVRRRLHPEGVVTYVIDRKISLTLPLQSIFEQVGDAIQWGGTGVHLTSALDPRYLQLDRLEDILRALKQRFPSLWLHGLSASAIVVISTQSALTPRDTLARLHAAGLGSLAGDDALILDDNFRQSPTCSAEQWLAVHRAAHSLGLGTAAAMTIGLGESPSQRVQHLERLCELQADTGGFTAFIPICFQPADRASGVHGRGEATAVEYLKTLAISRMVLDTIPNIQSSWDPHGLKVLQTALRFGGNDVGSVLGEFTPAPSAKAANRTTEEDLRRIIRDAGFHPIQRDTAYRTMFLN